jgi:hypothetical protein
MSPNTLRRGNPSPCSSFLMSSSLTHCRKTKRGLTSRISDDRFSSQFPSGDSHASRSSSMIAAYCFNQGLRAVLPSSRLFTLAVSTIRSRNASRSADLESVNMLGWKAHKARKAEWKSSSTLARICRNGSTMVERLSRSGEDFKPNRCSDAHSVNKRILLWVSERSRLTLAYKVLYSSLNVFMAAFSTSSP